MVAAQPQTIAEGLLRRIEDARYMRRFPELFVNSLLRDINKLKPLIPDLALSMQGNVYALLNEQENSINAYKEAIEINPSALNIYNLGFTYEIFNQFDLALDTYRLSFDKAINGNVTVLNALANRFIGFLSYNDLVKIKPELDKYQSNYDIEIIFRLLPLFENEQLMFDFGKLLNATVNSYILPRFVLGTEFREVEGRLHIVYLVNYSDDGDIEAVCECNSALSEIITDFVMKHQINFDDVSIYCEVIE